MKRSLFLLVLLPFFVAANFVTQSIHTLHLTVGGTPAPTPTPTPFAVPRGMLYLPSPTGTPIATILTNPSVDMVVVGGFWNTMNPMEDTYVWTQFDASIALVESASATRVAAGGRPLYMRVSLNTGGGFDNATTDTPPHVNGDKPGWVKTAIDGDAFGGTKYFIFDSSGGTTTKIPVFWEPTEIAKHVKWAQAVSTHLGASHPLIKVVAVAYANANTDDWNLGSIATTNDSQGTKPQTRWQSAAVAAGFSDMAHALVSAGNDTFAGYRTAFSNIGLTTPIGRLDDSILNASSINVSELVVVAANTAKPGYVIAQLHRLNGYGVPHADIGGSADWDDLYHLHIVDGIPIAAQDVWRAWNDCDISGDLHNGDPCWSHRMNFGTATVCTQGTTTMKAAFDTAFTYGVNWVEVYEIDCRHLSIGNGCTPDNSDILAYGHGLIYPTP